MNIINRLRESTPLNFKMEVDGDNYMRYFLESDNYYQVIGLGSILDGEFRGMKASIYFKNIEKIIDPKFILGENNPTIDIDGHQFLFNKDKSIEVHSLLPIDLSTEKDLQQSCQIIEQYVKQIAEPFFSYWQDIRTFLPFLETDDIRFLSTMFCGDALFKKLVIWKFCNHPNYEEYKIEKLKLIESRLQEKSNDKIYKRNYTKLKKILKTLEKTEPLYDWDNKYLEKKPLLWNR